MRQADLGRAQMTGVQMGELPFLTENDEVCSCAYSPDGKLFAVGLGNGEISEYATSNWERTRTLSHGGTIWRVVHSPRGDQVASCGKDETVKLWDAETGECLHVLGNYTVVTCVSYSPEGDRVASSSAEPVIRIWDVITGECLQTLSGHIEGVLCVAYSPQGNQIASGGMNYVVRLWDVESGVAVIYYLATTTWCGVSHIHPTEINSLLQA